MLKSMRKFLGVSLVLALGVSIGSTSASAASTRAEYVAQVDPICQTYVAPVQSAFVTYQRSMKRLNRTAKSGTFRAFARSTRRVASSLGAIAQLHQTMIDQIAAVPAPPDPAIGTWLGYLRQEQGLEAAASTAVAGFRFVPFFRLLRQADRAMSAARTASAGLGFQVCGVAV